jgi:hypothetical protein
MSSGELLVLLTLEFAIRVTNGQERDELPSLYGSRSSVSSWSSRIVILPRKVPVLPFYSSKEGPVIQERG